MAQKPSSFFLLYGRETFLKHEFLRELSSQTFPNAETARLNTRHFHADDEAALGAFLEFVQTSTFFDDKKLAIFWQVDELDEEVHSKVFDALKNLSATAVVALETEQTNLKKDTFLAALSRTAQAKACHTPFDNDLPGWVRARAAKRKKELNQEACQEILERCGKDLGAIDGALEQLSIYTAERRVIEVADIEKLLGRSAQTDAFLLIDFILNRDAKQALALAQDMLKSGKKALEIAGVLASQWEKLRKAAQMIKKGESATAAAASLKVHPFFQDKFIRQAKLAAGLPLDKVLKDLAACDEALKRGVLSERLALERLVLQELTLKN